MYLHIGENKVIPLNRLLGIFDCKAFDWEICEIMDISGGEAKSVVVEIKSGSPPVAYISKISSHTLIKRVYEIGLFNN